MVCDTERLRPAAERHGAAFLRPAGEGETTAVERAAAWSIARGYAAQLVIPADMARLDRADVRTLVEAPRLAPSLIHVPGGRRRRHQRDPGEPAGRDSLSFRRPLVRRLPGAGARGRHSLPGAAAVATRAPLSTRPTTPALSSTTTQRT
ncbi:MAG: hypothetical protein R3F55_04445 [Alphaproteobacteria bacterium]